jgi:hypothetical protein
VTVYHKTEVFSRAFKEKYQESPAFRIKIICKSSRKGPDVSEQLRLERLSSDTGTLWDGFLQFGDGILKDAVIK